MPQELQRAITSASDAAFLHGPHTAMACQIAEAKVKTDQIDARVLAELFVTPIKGGQDGGRAVAPDRDLAAAVRVISGHVSPRAPASDRRRS
jgi:hypothetical protein